MASASNLLSEEQFLCSICLEVFTDPVTTPCGHNYCNTCITHYWDSSDACKCPLCNKTFYWRPESSVNKVLSEMADQFKNSKNLKPAKPDEVSCDACTEPKLKAVKSCLQCLASYCNTHLEPHQRGAAFKRHKLINPVKNLEDILCKKHDRPLELFCKTDHTCVCHFCTESDHRSHHVVSLKEAYEGKKAELGKTEAEVQQMIQKRQGKIQEVKHSVQLSKKDADREMADGLRVCTALIRCIERSRSELINVIIEKQKTTAKQAEVFIKELQHEITQLEKRSSELKRLSHTEDHLQLLQNFTSITTPPPTMKDWTKVGVHPSSYVGTVSTAVHQLKKTLNKEMEKQCAGTAMQVAGATAGKFMAPIHPWCKEYVFGKMEGDQPDGTMTWKISSPLDPLPGFPHCGTITIDYDIPGGTQTTKHPNPGKYYDGTRGRAYLPYNTEGSLVLRLLKKAFDQKLIFTVRDDQVIWSSIHHKTNTSGGPQGRGYPDDNYLSRVRAELKAKGIE